MISSRGCLKNSTFRLCSGGTSSTMTLSRNSRRSDKRRAAHAGMPLRFAATAGCIFCWGLLTGAVAPTSAAPAAVAPWATAPIDLNGIFVRVGNLWLNPIPDSADGTPVQPIRVRGPDAGNIYAGNSDNPILQPWARAIVKANADSELNRQHVFTADDTCWPSGVPQAVNLPDGVRFVQAKDHIVIVYQRNRQLRWIWLDREHSTNVKPSWYGESVGHFEGNILVVDTIGVKAHKMSVVDPFG